MKAIIALLLTATIASAAPRLSDYLSTRSIKYGRGATIEVTIIQHPDQEMLLEYDNGKDEPIRKYAIPAGTSKVTMSLQCWNGWKATLVVNGRMVDQETATRKTGMKSRIGL